MVKEKRRGEEDEGIHSEKTGGIQVKQWEQVGDGGTGAKEMKVLVKASETIEEMRQGRS